MKRILLDTNTFNNKSMLKLIKIHSQKGKVQAFVNPIIYLEIGFIYQVRKKFSLFKNILKATMISCVPLNEISSEKASKLALTFKDDPRGPEHFFRDCLIGATAIENDLTLITNNKKDFPYLTDIYSPQEFIDDFP